MLLSAGIAHVGSQHRLHGTLILNLGHVLQREERPKQ